MFLVGIFAVYIVYANINNGGLRCSKGKENYSDRDTSLRRMGSERELPTTITTRNKRALRSPQRTGSERSTISEKSV